MAKQYKSTPKGRFRFPAIVTPDYGNDQFPKPNGEFKVQLILGPKEAAILAKELQPLHDQAVEEGREKFAGLKVEQRKKLGDLKITPLFEDEYDKETEEPTGNKIFKFGTAASGVNKKTGEPWKRHIVVYDAQGNVIKKPPQIWGGTVGKVGYECSPYFVPGQGMAGLKLYLAAVQIIELVSGGGGDASQFGFGKEEGYVAQEDEQEQNLPFEPDNDEEVEF